MINSLFKNSKITKLWAVLLITVIILGSFLIFFELGKKSLWLDEIFSASHSKQPLKNILFYNPSPDKMWNNSHPILHYILMHFSFKIGASDFFARFPSAVFGVMLIILVFLAGRELFDEQTGVIAAFLSAISGLLVAHAQEARMYSHFAFFSVLSVLFLIKILYSEEEKPVYWIGFILSASANLYTHTFAVLVCGSEIVFSAAVIAVRIVLKKDVKKNVHKFIKILFALLIIALITSPEFLKNNNMLKQNVGGIKPARGAKLSFSFLEKIIAQFTIPESFWVPKFYTLLFVIGCIFCLARKPDFFFLMFFWAAIPLIAITTAKAKHFFNVRYIIFILPVFLIFTAYGFRMIFGLFDKTVKKLFPKTGKVDFVLILVLILCITLGFAHYPMFKKFYSGEKDNWKAAALYIKENAVPQDLIISDFNGYGCFGYYLKMFNINNRFIYEPKETALINPDDLWFVTYTTRPDKFPENYKLIEKKDFGSNMVRLYHFKKFEQFKITNVNISSSKVLPGKMMAVALGIENPDKNLIQTSCLWLYIKPFGAENSESEDEAVSSIADIMFLEPSSKIKKEFFIKAPEKPGKYELCIRASNPPYAFFPANKSFFYQIGRLEKDKNSPLNVIIKAVKGMPYVGYLMYGPYGAFPHGKYIAGFFISADFLPEKPVDAGAIDVVSDNANVVYAKKNISSSLIKNGKYNLIKTDIEIGGVRDLEFRLLCIADIGMKCGGVVLINKDSQEDPLPVSYTAKKNIPFNVVPK